MTRLDTMRYCPWCGKRLEWRRVESTVTIGCATTYTTYAREPKVVKLEAEKEKRDRESVEKDRKGWGLKRQ